MTAIAYLNDIALLMDAFPGTTVIDGELGAHALEYAATGWEIFPLNGKTPLIRNPHPKGSIERDTCKGECGLDGHGVLDATDDTATIVLWWTQSPNANIGGRVPAGLVVVDLDPRNDGCVEWLNERQADYGPLPETLIAMSGRGDGGCHRYFQHPGGPLATKRPTVPQGIDLKNNGGYCVLPPSKHPDTGRAYEWVDLSVVPAEMPGWLVTLLRPAVPVIATKRHDDPMTDLEKFFAYSPQVGEPDSIAEWYTTHHEWGDVLEGWQQLDAAGTCWRHPTATSPASATIRHDCLFVYSPNTPFTQTTPGDPHGYTRFRAYAVLNHGGDLSAAARAARALWKANR